MRPLRRFVARLLGSFGDARRERDLADELESHLQLHIQDKVRAGMDPGEARRHAILALGGIERTKERWRDQRRVPIIDHALQDLRYAVRILWKAPAFTATVVLVLGLGIGASTIVYSVVDAVLLRPMPFTEPERLVMLRLSSGSRLSAAYLHEWRRHSRTLADLAGWHDGRMNLTGAGDPIEVQVDRVTPNFFALIGTSPVIGRTFVVRPDLSHVDSEVVLSYGLWQRAFGGEDAVIGRSITLDGDSFAVVGVMPPGFSIRTNELSRSRAELWTPLPLGPRVPAGIGGFLNVVGRLAPGAEVEGAQVELAAIAQRIESDHPSPSPDWRLIVLPLRQATVADVRLGLLTLFGCAGILLVIACVNVAGLSLGRAEARQTEIAVRMSVGATTGRLVRQFLTESAVLAAAGGALGVLLAIRGTALFVSSIPAGLELPRAGEIRVDTSALAFAVFAMALTVVLSGLLPSLTAARWWLPSSLQATRRGSPGRGRIRALGALVTAEVALAAVLLCAAGLLARSFHHLTRVDVGFRPDQVLTMRTTLSPLRYDSDDRIRSYGTELLQRVSGLRGVRAAGLANYLPLSNYGEGAWFDIGGRPRGPGAGRPGSATMVVGGHYFDALGIPLVRGRLPGASDTARSEPVFVIDEALARQYWPAGDPVGARLTFERADGGRLSGTVIGVVRSVRWAAIAANPPGTTYFWFPHDPRREIAIAARVTGDPMAMADVIAAEVRVIDPNQPVTAIRTMQAFVSDELARPRYAMLLIGSFAAAALLLSTLGIYGVIALGVRQRSRELAVRAALGAQRRDILRLVLVRGALLIGSGLAIGLAAALVLGRVAASLLHGVTPRDVPTFVAVTVCLAAAGMLATYVPARLAARVDPIVALRAE